MASFTITTKKVTSTGTITGLKAHAGEEFFLVPKPTIKIPEVKVPANAEKAVSDLRRYVEAHVALATKQAEDFRAKHLGDVEKRVAKVEKQVANAVETARKTVVRRTANGAKGAAHAVPAEIPAN